jgi:hypothetical protein
MSHLSILPTVFTRLDLLETALVLEGFDVIRQGVLPDFGRAPIRGSAGAPRRLPSHGLVHR